MNKIYFDNAATTPMDKEVLQAMLPYMENHFGNPSSIHSFGRTTRSAIEEARKSIATCLNVSPGEIFFTSGGTEADNMAIRCSVHDFKIKHAITSRIEHHAVLHTLEELDKRGDIQLHFVKIDAQGNVDLTHLEELLKFTNERTLVSLMHANNEIGTLLPLKQVGDICAKYNALFHCDTVQTMAHYAFDLQAINVHFVVGAAHKFHGPKGVGFIYIKNDARIMPYITGGSQERNMRGGTENLYGIVGIAKALAIANAHLTEHQQQVQTLKQHFISELQRNFTDVQFNGNTNPHQSLYTVLNVSFAPNPNGEMLLFSLDIAGIAASGGSACTSGSNQGSHVLRGIGAAGDRPSVRFSFSKMNTIEEVDYTIAKLKEVLG
ncbi:MAG: cysteine desulfurase family protein [Bacteroidia bacterium]